MSTHRQNPFCYFTHGGETDRNADSQGAGGEYIFEHAGLDGSEHQQRPARVFHHEREIPIYSAWYAQFALKSYPAILFFVYTYVYNYEISAPCAGARIADNGIMLRIDLSSRGIDTEPRFGKIIPRRCSITPTSCVPS